MGSFLAELKRRHELITRADEQHQQVCRGDPRGTYGKAWPNVQKYEIANRVHPEHLAWLNERLTK